ncbi:unnamed protein product [Linum tenue]|uniref:Uncharacterized protein n=1 Tax=Linum tenue TaxID=586396 RepID=A0AAV0NEU2_9ROSI|nr:unnamed protein product [Linum tenue]
MCIVINAKDISVTGRKMTDKVYYWHTGQVSAFILFIWSSKMMELFF